MFHRRFHKGVEYQQRKNRENCDAFPPRPSIGGESADGGSAQAHVSWLRRQILSLEVSLESRLHHLKRSRSRTRHEFPVSLPQARRERALPRRHSNISLREESRADIRKMCI